MENNEIKKGDIIKVQGTSLTVDKIFYQDFDGFWDVEFLDAKGKCRKWKQFFDGGELIRKEEQA